VKKKVILIIFFSLNPFFTYTQQKSPYLYHSECNYWSFDSPGSLNNDVLPSLFSWQYVTTPVTNNINDIFFIDSSNGWAVHTGNGGLLSTNGGFTWQIISFNDTNFTTTYNGVYFINKFTGWMAGGSVQIRKTTNGGTSWFKQNSAPVAGVLNGIYFFDSSNGIAIGRKTASYNSFTEKTSNSGNNWFEIIISTANNNELHDQFWFDYNTGWICGRNVLLKTTNAGINWADYYSSIPPTQNGQNELLSVWFVNQQAGWIGASNLDKKNIYKTTNGGLNWIFQNNPVANYTYVQINDMRFLTPDSGWAIHGTPVSGAIMFTTDAGANWLIEEGSNYWFDCITTYLRYKAWCSSSAGRVWYTYLSSPVGLKKTNNGIPQLYKLYQNYPNPFNPVTTIEFDIVRKNMVGLSLYDITGKFIKSLINSYLEAGKYKFDFNSDGYSSGIYFCRLETPEFLETKKMVIIK